MQVKPGSSASSVNPERPVVAFLTRDLRVFILILLFHSSSAIGQDGGAFHEVFGFRFSPHCNTILDPSMYLSLVLFEGHLVLLHVFEVVFSVCFI